MRDVGAGLLRREMVLVEVVVGTEERAAEEARGRREEKEHRPDPLATDHDEEVDVCASRRVPGRDRARQRQPAHERRVAEDAGDPARAALEQARALEATAALGEQLLAARKAVEAVPPRHDVPAARRADARPAPPDRRAGARSGGPRRGSARSRRRPRR